MLPNSSRLRADKDFDRLFKRGKSASLPGFSLRYGYKGKGETMFAFVVGVKVSKRAVVRNLLRRRMRAVVGSVRSAIIPGFDAAITARPDALRLAFPEIKRRVLELLVKAGILPRQ